MSDRLAELLRQRAALQEQLAQLDRQIAEAKAATSALPRSTPPPAAFPKNISAESLSADPEAMISQYQTGTGQIATDVRKGCLLYAGVALAFFLFGIFLLLRFFHH
jgi:hypothetical protein